MFIDREGVRQLAGTLRATRESLVPDGPAVKADVAGVNDPDSVASCAAFASACDRVMLELAGEVDAMAINADRAASAWHAAEQHNTQSFTGHRGSP